MEASTIVPVPVDVVPNPSTVDVELAPAPVTDTSTLVGATVAISVASVDPIMGAETAVSTID